MKHVTRIALASCLVAGAAVAITGCKEDGPATKAGKAVDKGVQKAGETTGDALHKTGDAVKDATK
jgi:hypothetical protein